MMHGCLRYAVNKCDLTRLHHNDTYTCMRSSRFRVVAAVHANEDHRVPQHLAARANIDSSAIRGTVASLDSQSEGLYLQLRAAAKAYWAVPGSRLLIRPCFKQALVLLLSASAALLQHQSAVV